MESSELGSISDRNDDQIENHNGNGNETKNADEIGKFCDNLNTKSNRKKILNQFDLSETNQINQLYTDIIAKDINNIANNQINSKLLYLKNLQIQCNTDALKDLVRATENAPLIETRQQNRMRLAFGVLLRLVIPLANSVAKGLKGIRDVQILRPLRNLPTSRQALINMLSYAANTISMSLSSVQVAHRIDPILKMIKLRRGDSCIESLPDTLSIPMASIIREPRVDFVPNNDGNILNGFETPEKTVTLNVLAEPPTGMPIRADIILIHGLHGSLVNTWKQGLWSKTRGPVNFERPPKPPLRPPKRPRHSRSNVFVPPHTTKRKRFADREHFTLQHDSEIFESDYYDCETDASCPTFRLRSDENISSRNSDGNSATDSNQNDPSTNSDEYSKCWPGDWLPLDCPGVRVIAVDYTTDQYLWRPVWKKKEARTNLVQRAREMTKLLIEQRVGYGHPIVWVGHSKGGLFVKQIIVEAWESGQPDVAPFWRSARGVFFYSVPHRGSHLASINAPLMRRSVELIDIEKNSKYLLDLHRRFAGLYQMRHLKIEVFSFVETALTLMSVLYLRIVGVDSADPGIGEVCGIHLDHREICKPRNRDCILYKELVKMIKKVC